MVICSMGGKQITPKSSCDALDSAGITDPDSKEGVEFCAGVLFGRASLCPYPRCIVFEGKLTKKELGIMRGAKVRKFREYNVTVKDISLVLDMSEYSVRRYLRK